MTLKKTEHRFIVLGSLRIWLGERWESFIL